MRYRDFLATAIAGATSERVQIGLGWITEPRHDLDYCIGFMVFAAITICAIYLGGRIFDRVRA